MMLHDRRTERAGSTSARCGRDAPTPRPPAACCSSGCAERAHPAPWGNPPARIPHAIAFRHGPGVRSASRAEILDARKFPEHFLPPGRPFPGGTPGTLRALQRVRRAGTPAPNAPERDPRRQKPSDGNLVCGRAACTASSFATPRTERELMASRSLPLRRARRRRRRARSSALVIALGLGVAVAAGLPLRDPRFWYWAAACAWARCCGCGSRWGAPR
jgi:hypothetical protein